MGKGRLEAFSDGVLAIIITVMLLEMKVPKGSHISDLRPVLPVFITYILSYANIGIYWNNHHHMLHAATSINAKVMWANTHLLFWLSLIPFATGWMGENQFSTWPVALYGFVLFMSGLAYSILAATLTLSISIAGGARKAKLSQLLYFIAIILAFINPWISLAIYGLVAAMWFIPDPRIERRLAEEAKNNSNLMRKD